MSAKSWKLPNEHFFEGVKLYGLYPPESVRRTKEFKFRPDDIIVLSYPKAGMYT